ncbi:rhodanese-like domain-containing protein [Anaerosporobacter faecicola]|uniref:rhodanese-like domain-containing protein n=1 Tax=Anaerosporobacter faecicola TaxID=2718714 RepID=UPI00143BA15A|nr:rhodanese-like domain-containing protein [Anaerosporobacter faecicola]
MKKLFWLVFFAVFITACNRRTTDQGKDGNMNREQNIILYEQITAKEAKKLMDEPQDAIILDVRTEEEYEEGHIDHAILLPHDRIDEEVSSILPEKDQMILVYCRSGVRSKQAALKLAELGYTNIKEFGGILDWPYEIEK